MLQEIDRRTPESVTAIHLVSDNVITHRGKPVRAWLAKRPRFQMHHTPVHCSWMNQEAPWFSIDSPSAPTAWTAHGYEAPTFFRPNEGPR